MFRDRYDVIVVGAGPAGSMAARTAAEHGLDVLLIEKRQEIGVPVRCAEATGKRGLEELGIKIDRRWIANEIRGWILVSPSGLRVSRVMKDVQGYILERKLFDKYLAIDAARKGAEVFAKTMATGLIVENGFVRGVKLKHMGEKHEVRAEIVIGADGVESRIARWAGLRDVVKKMVNSASNVQFKMVGVRLEAPDIMEFYFGRNVAPGGYLWVFPKGEDFANVGVGIQGSEQRAIYYLRKFIAENRERFRGASIVEINAGLTPVGGPLEKTYGNGFMIVGDAASFIDPLTGGGIYTAMLTGKLAAETAAEAIEAGDTSENFLARYQERWREALGRKIEMQLKVKEALLNLSDEDLDKIAEILQGKDLTSIGKKDVLKLFVEHPKLFKYIKDFLGV